MFHPSMARLATGFGACALIAACHAALPSARLVTTALPATLSAPDASDWSLSRFASPALAKSQGEHFRARLLAYPDASPAWAGGLSLAAYGCTPGDSAPNGPAVAFPASGSLVNKLFFLTRAGTLIKLDRLSPASFTKVELGGTCTRTAVTLSPFSTRAYVLTDDGTLQVVDTTTMAIKATLQVPGGYGIAPVVDRIASAPYDVRDVLYVPANDGTVRSFVIEKTAAAPYIRVSGPTVYDVASTASPLIGSRKLAAPALAHGGKLYVGDQAGDFHVYDTANPAASYVYGLGAPVNTAPSLVLQDGTYAVTDAAGSPKPVSHGEPIHAFVSAGASCAWINLHETTTTYSPALRIDDNDPTRKFGHLLDYGFSTAGKVERLVAEDGGNVNTEAPDRPLPGYPTIWSNDYLVPAATNTFEVAGEAEGGPVVSYLRFRSSALPAAGALVAQATLSLSPAFDQACRPAHVKAAAPFFRGTTTPWTSDRLTTASRPAVGGTDVGRYLSGGVSAAGNVTFKKNRTYEWDVSRAFSTATSHYALALDHQGDDAVLWPEGPVGGAIGKKARKAHQVEAVKFHNNALNADPQPASARDSRPVLSLTIASTALPTATLETPPAVDPVGRRVYVFYTNAIYSLDFSSPAAFSDTDPSGARHTLFNVAHYGDVANGGGTHDGRKRFVANLTAPSLSYDFSAAYVLSRYPAVDGPAPTNWNYALNKVALPLSATADRRVAGAPTFAAVTGEASAVMLMDPPNKLKTGGNVYFGLGDGKLYQAEP